MAPAVVPLTATLIEQEPLDVSEPPDKLMLVFPMAGANRPPQVFVPAGIAATSIPGGKASLIANPLSAKAFGLVKFSVNVDVPLSGMLDGEKLLATVGGLATVSEAVAVLPVPPLPELTVTLLFLTPEVVTLTVAWTWQVLPGVAMLAPPRLMVPEPSTAVTEPPQVLVGAGGLATTIPGGRESIKVIVDSAPGFAAGLVIVKVTVVVPFTGSELAPKLLVICGAVNTLSVAVLLVVPVPPSVEVIAPVVLGLAPAVVPITFTLIVQGVPAVTAAFETFSEVAPGVKLDVFVLPPQLLTTTPGDVSTCRPPGKLSLKPTPVSVPLAFGLAMVKVNCENVPPTKILVGLKALEIVGGPRTVSVTVPVAALLPPSSVVASVALLGLVPADVPLTLRLMVHEAVATNDPPDHVTEPPPGDAPTEPSQVVLRLLGVSTTKPAGSVSMKPTPERAEVALLLVIVNVRLVEPLSGTDEAPNALLNVGALITVSVAAAVPLGLACVEVAVLDVLGFAPSVVLRTLTVTPHVPPAPIEPPLNDKLVAPAVGAKVGEPHPAVDIVTGLATSTPAGSESVNATAVRTCEGFGLTNWKVSAETPVFVAIVVGLNALLKFGA